MKAVWVIVRTDYEHHTDRKGRSHIVSAAYGTVKEANSAARKLLAAACRRPRDDDLVGIQLEGEKNVASATTEYEVTARVHEDERDHLAIRVRKLKFHHAEPVSSASGTKRKAPNCTHGICNRRAGEEKQIKTADAVGKSKR